MLQENFNVCMAIASLIVGIIAAALMWAYMYEIIIGSVLIDLSVYKKYVRAPFLFSVIMMAVLWLTTSGIEGLLFNSFVILFIAWTITIIVGFIFSLYKKLQLDRRKYLRTAMQPCIIRLIVIAIVLWLIY